MKRLRGYNHFGLAGCHLDTCRHVGIHAVVAGHGCQMHAGLSLDLNLGASLFIGHLAHVHTGHNAFVDAGFITIGTRDFRFGSHHRFAGEFDLGGRLLGLVDHARVGIRNGYRRRRRCRGQTDVGHGKRVATLGGRSWEYGGHGGSPEVKPFGNDSLFDQSVRVPRESSVLIQSLLMASHFRGNDNHYIHPDIS